MATPAQMQSMPMAGNSQFPPVHMMTREGLQTLMMRSNTLKQAGFTNQNSQELASINQYLSMFKRFQMARNAQAQQAQAQLAAPTPKPAIEIPATNGSAPSPPASPVEPITFTQAQLVTLRSQINAFKYLQRGLPIPLEFQQGIHPQSSADESDQLTAPPGQLLENDTSSLIYPYNAYTHPTTRLATAKNHRAILPSMTPLGLDPLALKAARERFVEARIAQRIRELSALPSTIGEPEPEVDETQEAAEARKAQ
ncbi:hypothetical protein RSOLAG1IB_02954 [Rhizoctonia solani AG-1 IB]|uniref:QLQ domain-containing protein n=1 Tax=Thanatephorus cucumeris (strain AG1-IB / isolate 7/3/14) TaxID=1108050 RepID=A0A0B7FMT3_THACB|nr:hypothetical protein RSOLAG1IB_02954 [Rhizoctonia solani AG-1 IB]